MSVTQELTNATHQATAPTLPGHTHAAVLQAIRCPATATPAKVPATTYITKILGLFACLRKVS